MPEVTKIQLKDVNNAPLYPKTSADIVVYDGEHTVADKVSAIETTAGSAVQGVTVNGSPASVSNNIVALTIPTTAGDVSALPASTKYGAAISLSINSETYVVTAQLKDQDGNNLGASQTIDLPLESVVVNGSYDAQTKKVILTLQSGSTIEFSVADLVAGLQSEITAQSPLASDLVDDTNSTTHKFVTTTEKSTWSAKQDALTFDNVPTVNSDNPAKSGGIFSAIADAKKMTGYSKPAQTSAVVATDTFAEAIGKLEAGLDGKAASSHTHGAADVTALTGYTVASQVADVAATDTLLEAIGKLQAAINDLNTGRITFTPIAEETPAEEQNGGSESGSGSGGTEPSIDPSDFD